VETTPETSPTKENLPQADPQSIATMVSVVKNEPQSPLSALYNKNRLGKQERVVKFRIFLLITIFF